MFRAASLPSRITSGNSADASHDAVPALNEYAADRAPSSAGCQEIGEFREGPGLRECSRPVIRFLRHWSLRPLSVWRQDLICRDWAPWQASVVIRIATFLWFIGGHLAIVLLVIAVLFALAVLSGS